MRSTDEQLQEILRRTELVRENRGIRTKLRTSAAACVVCALLLITACISLPRLRMDAASPEMQPYGSLLLAAPYLGYVIVCILAFALGICVTLLCVHWKRWKERMRK